MDSSIGSMIGFLIPLVLVVLAIGFVLGRRGRDNRNLSGPPRTAARPRMAPASPRPAQNHGGGGLDPAARMEIEAALNANQKIEAIKLLREATGMGLKEAKDAVENGSF